MGVGILTDKHFEEMCNPTKNPCVKFGLMSNRKVKLTARKYFNQRLFDEDGRFAKDIEYFLTAQYALKSKQVADDASIMLLQTQGGLHLGQVLSRHAVAGCHPDDHQTIGHHPNRREHSQCCLKKTANG